MKPTELLERLRTLARAGGATQTVLLAPLNMPQANYVVEHLNRMEIEIPRPERLDGHVTSQDVLEFVRWVERLAKEQGFWDYVFDENQS